jgi:pimeloyl-ACP methyl ester carboxylesterase
MLLGCLLTALLLGGSGCGRWMAHRLAQAPNSYPQWFAPKPRVELAFEAGFITNFPASFLEIGPPAARLRYRVVDPADYGVTASSTNWWEGRRHRFRFSFHASLPGKPLPHPSHIRGTVVLLHGYGLSQVTMAPWALRLAQEGWRTVMVDLRGHGKSTGKRIFYGVREADDLRQLADELARQGRLAGPLVALGDSYGAALALRWQTRDPRVRSTVAMAPYAELAPAALNLRREYARFFPARWVKAGFDRMPKLLEVTPAELDTIRVLQGHPVEALFIAGGRDAIAPPDEVRRLRELATPTSRFLLVEDSVHEVLPYQFEELTGPVLEWLDRVEAPGLQAKEVSHAEEGAASQP